MLEDWIDDGTVDSWDLYEAGLLLLGLELILSGLTSFRAENWGEYDAVFLLWMAPFED